MKIAPHPPNETSRLAALQRYCLLDSPPDPILDNITKTAAIVCGTPISLISLIDSNRQWFKSNVGMSVQETQRDLAFCTHAILKPDEILEVEDATRMSGFALTHWLPETQRSGFMLASRISNKPLKLSSLQKNALKHLAQAAIDLLNERTKSGVRSRDSKAMREMQFCENIAAKHQPSANSPTIYPNTFDESKPIPRGRLRGKNKEIVESLTGIVSSAVEYDLHIEPIRLVNLMYFYCNYLESTFPRHVYVSDKIIELRAVPATFSQFIFNQTLLDETAANLSNEEGEHVMAPKAIEN